MTKILIVDNSPIFRLGLKSFINGKADFMVTGETDSGAEAVKMVSQFDYDVILLEINALRTENTEIIIRELMQKPSHKVIALSHYENEEEIMKVLRAGCNGLVYKSGDVEQLALAIERVILNQDYYSKEVAEVILNRFARGNPDIKSLLHTPGFSERELAIIRLICMQKTAKEIALKLHISEKTVDFHRQKIITKMRVKNIVGLVIYAIKKKVVEIEEIELVL